MGSKISIEVPVTTVAPSRPTRPPRLVVVNSQLDGLELLTTAVLAEHALTVFDPRKVKLENIASAVESYKSKFASIAIICHGNQGAMKLMDGPPMDIKALKDSKVASFWKRLAACVAPGGRIDLLGCSVAGGEVGGAFLKKLEVITKVDFAASVDTTSSAAGTDDSKKKAGDLYLETDNVDAGSLYFDMTRMAKYPHSLCMGAFCGGCAGAFMGGPAGAMAGIAVGSQLGW